MTRYGGLGRTRPKKLTSKASIPIVREHEIDLIDDEIQSTLQQIETGVEKAEESVSVPNEPLIFSLIPACDHVIASPKRHEIFTVLTSRRAPHRNSICKPQSMLPRKAKTRMLIFRLARSSSVTFHMPSCILRSSRSRRHTSASPPQWRTVADVRTT